MRQQGSNIEVSATVVRCFFRQFDGGGRSRSGQAGQGAATVCDLSAPSANTAGEHAGMSASLPTGNNAGAHAGGGEVQRVPGREWVTPEEIFEICAAVYGQPDARRLRSVAEGSAHPGNAPADGVSAEDDNKPPRNAGFNCVPSRQLRLAVHDQAETGVRDR